MSTLNDFEIFAKYSQDRIITDSLSTLKIENKYYVNLQGNYLARKEGVFKSFEILANKIAEDKKAVVMFAQNNRFVIVFNGFWDEYHKSVKYEYVDIDERKLNKLIETAKVFGVGFAPKYYLIIDGSENGLIVQKVVKQKIAKINLLSIKDIETQIKECNYIENNIEKSKKITTTIFLSVASIFVLNFIFAYGNGLIESAQKKEISIIDNNIATIQTDLKIEQEKRVDLEKRLHDGKVWCN